MKRLMAESIECLRYLRSENTCLKRSHSSDNKNQLLEIRYARSNMVLIRDFSYRVSHDFDSEGEGQYQLVLIVGTQLSKDTHKKRSNHFATFLISFSAWIFKMKFNPMPDLLYTGFTIIEINLFYGGEYLRAKICGFLTFLRSNFSFWQISVNASLLVSWKYLLYVNF